MTARNLDPRRKKLLFQSQRMGMHENDILVGGFVDAHIEKLDEEQLGQIEYLMGANDVDIFQWITRRTPTPVDYDTAIMAMIRDFNKIK